MDYKQLIDMLTELSDEAHNLDLPQKELFELQQAIVIIMTHVFEHYINGGTNND